MAGPQLSLVVTLALASSPGVCSPPEKWEIKGPVSVTLPSAAVTENPSSNWFKQKTYFISLNREFEVECSRLNSVVPVLYISLLCHLRCADLVLGYLPSL